MFTKRGFQRETVKENAAEGLVVPVTINRHCGSSRNGSPGGANCPVPNRTEPGPGG